MVGDIALKVTLVYIGYSNYHAGITRGALVLPALQQWIREDAKKRGGGGGYFNPMQIKIA